MQKLGGKVAIVTGASRGIGRAVAQRLYAEGANLVLASLPEHGNAEDVIKQIGASTARALVVEGDLRQIKFVKRLFEETEQRFGGEGPGHETGGSAGGRQARAQRHSIEGQHDQAGGGVRGGARRQADLTRGGFSSPAGPVAYFFLAAGAGGLPVKMARSTASAMAW